MRNEDKNHEARVTGKDLKVMMSDLEKRYRATSQDAWTFEEMRMHQLYREERNKMARCMCMVLVVLIGGGAVAPLLLK